MLPITHRDEIQRLALSYRENERLMRQSFAKRTPLGGLIFVSGMLALAGLFGTIGKELFTVAFIVFVGSIFYWWLNDQNSLEYIKVRQLIEKQFQAMQLEITYEGSIRQDGRYFDPFSSDSYNELKDATD